MLMEMGIITQLRAMTCKYNVSFIIFGISTGKGIVSRKIFYTFLFFTSGSRPVIIIP